MSIGEKIKELRIQSNLTQEELAAYANTTKQTIHKYETGIISNIPASKIKAISERLGTTPAYLMGWEEENTPDTVLSFPNIFPIEKKRFPLLGEIACGEPIFCDEDRESYIVAGTDINADFCLTCKGDSMINARINDGDIVFIRQQPMVENGEIAAVVIDNDATLKRVFYYPDEGRLILNPENSRYAPLVFTGEEINNIRILGKAVAFQSDIK